MPKSNAVLTQAEKAQMQLPHGALYWSAMAGANFQLYHQLVREFLTSEKIKAFIDKKADGPGKLMNKITHVYERYLPLYAGMDREVFDDVVQKAFKNTTGVDLFMGYRASAAAQADKAASNSKKATAATVGSVGASGAATGAGFIGLIAQAASTATGGVITILDTGRAARIAFKAGKRQEVAQAYIKQYHDPTDDSVSLIAAASKSALSDDDRLLGEIAAYAAKQSSTLSRRQWTRVAGGVVGVVGAGISLTGVGAPIGVPMAVAGTAISLAPTAESGAKAAAKKYDGTQTLDRHQQAVALWYLGKSGHGPSLQFMVDMGILPVPNGDDDHGEMATDMGFFTNGAHDAALKYIEQKLRSS